MKKLMGSTSVCAWKKHSLSAVIGCLALVSLSSVNADEGYEISEPQAPYFTGFYLGANVDYGFSHSHAHVGCVSPALNFSFSPNCFEAIEGGAFATEFRPHPKGFLGGVQAGYDFRFTNTVLGVVTDIAAGSISGSSSLETDVPTFFPELSTVDAKISWLGTLRGRFGFVVNNLLAYATGGLAYGRVKTSYDLEIPTVLVASQSSTGWQTGWTAGAGAQMSFCKFIVSAEYLYFDLGGRDVSPSPVVFGVPQPTTYFPTSFDSRGQLFRLGIHLPIG
jgi:outer membrane immunogenic protein